MSEGKLASFDGATASRIEDRTVEIVFDEPGAEAYVFTFG